MGSLRSDLNLRVEESLLCCTARSLPLSAGSSQPAEAETKTQSMSHRSDAVHLPWGQMSGQGLGNQGVHTQPMEMMLHLKQAIEKHMEQLATRHQQQDLVPEEERPHQAPGEQGALLGNLMYQLVNLLHSGATGGQGLQPSCPSLDVKGDAGGGQWQWAQSSRQPAQPGYQLNDPEATFVSRHLSSRGIDISAVYQSSFRDYKMYQGDKYHEDENTLLSQSDMNVIEDVLLQYPDWSGQPFLREEVARFLTCYCKAPAQLDPENVVVLNGCSSVFSTLAMVLCDPGEAFLTPTPFYGGFFFSSHLYSKAELIPVHLDSEGTDANPCPFQLTVDKLERALLEATLAVRRDPGLRGDFGISGFRFGVLYTHNKEVASAVGSFGCLHGISGIVQYKLCRLLQDQKWIDTVYLPAYRSRLQKAHRYITKKLKALGIPFLNRGSGLYIWINLQVYLDPCTFEEELLLHHRFLDNKLMLSRGKTYTCKEPGWFRIVFADKPLRLKQAMHRFYQVLEEQKQRLRMKQLESTQRE
ncbi:probable inactive 1-aminocyclopropane-1-carboxylate synthase-like protein 2 [Meles meles]|uniref:probable inactive 1-aminocyclopropane-1-carboxylate synthase-like protein 2 n=1 Tax=Meles meles TaxID=9662 RepID=UPI001E698E56|nr:probable inactive 1-aminocyclopropane-1-carboxylate synthase-like protein 2 [Meles meles]